MLSIILLYLSAAIKCPRTPYFSHNGSASKNVMYLPPKMSFRLYLQLLSIYFVKELIGCIEMAALKYVIKRQTISSICRSNYNNKIGRPPPKMSCSCLLKCHLCSVTTYTSLICLLIIRVHCVNCTKTYDRVKMHIITFWTEL